MKSNKCYPVTDCSHLNATLWAYDSTINQCVNKQDGSVYKPQANVTSDQPTKDCIHGHFDQVIGVCVCDIGWYLNFKYGTCSD
jgi:hypothetical protein